MIRPGLIMPASVISMRIAAFVSTPLFRKPCFLRECISLACGTRSAVKGHNSLDTAHCRQMWHAAREGELGGRPPSKLHLVEWEDEKLVELLVFECLRDA